MPISEAQRNANQANAQNSTGPRTPEGKATAALNGLQHGFRSGTVLLPGEDPAEFQLLHDIITAERHPTGFEQERCVREMADAEWRLRRARLWIASAHSRLIRQLQEAHPEADPTALEVQAFADGKAELDPLLRHESKFERQYERASRRLLALQREQAATTAPQNRTTEPISPPAAAPTSAKTAQTPRNAACPCGSKLKYKRCCGQNAPPILNNLPRAA